MRNATDPNRMNKLECKLMRWYMIHLDVRFNATERIGATWCLSKLYVVERPCWFPSSMKPKEGRAK